MKKTLFNVVSALLLSVLLSPTAFAHSGHHGENLVANLWHLVSQTSHWPLLFCLALPILTVLVRKRRNAVRAKNASQ